MYSIQYVCSCCLTLTFHHLSSLVSIPHISFFLHSPPTVSSCCLQSVSTRAYIYINIATTCRPLC